MNEGLDVWFADGAAASCLAGVRTHLIERAFDSLLVAGSFESLQDFGLVIDECLHGCLVVLPPFDELACILGDLIQTLACCSRQLQRRIMPVQLREDSAVL
jgi:hypothetical protein